MQTRNDTVNETNGEPALLGPPSSRYPAAEEMSVLDIFIVLARRKSTILGVAGVLTFSVLAISLLLPAIYTSTTTILPPQQSRTAAMLAQLGGLADIAGKEMGIKSNEGLFVSMLQSRRVADALATRFNLKRVYDERKMVDVRDMLADRTDIVVRQGVILISVDDKSPQRAAQLANGYVEELYRVTQDLAFTEASQRRVFFEKQLQAAKVHLADAEVALRNTQESTQLIQLDGQARAIIDAVARLRAQIAAGEVGLRSLLLSTTEQNPEVIRMRETLAALRGQLAKLERNQSTGDSGTQIPTSKVPEVGLQYVRSLREVRYQEMLFELLAKQLELAKIDEARDAPLIQVVDVAAAAEKKSRPKRLLMIIIAAVTGLLLGTISAIFLEALERMMRSSKYNARLQMLRLHLHSWNLKREA